MSSGAVPAAPLGLMSCVRESSPQDLLNHHHSTNTDLDCERNESSKKRRFHPFRGLRKMFRRGKVRNAGSEETVPTESGGGSGSGQEDTSSSKESHRSRSTSELLAADEPTRRKSSGGGALVSGVGGGMFPGGGALSVSHDSVFTAEQHSTRGDSTSSDLDTAQSSSSLSIQQLMQHTAVRAELIDAVRRRGRERGDTSEDDEDLGLPRSPCNSPTNTDKPIKDHQTKSHSTCSDGSLLSMGSSEMDEESFGQHSRHSSKLSLHDRRPTLAADSELELGINTSIAAPLSHSAARHKMSVRPKRTHGAPRRRRVQQLNTTSALPTTPEVNEDVSTRSLTPESSTTRETIAELYSSSSTSMSKVWSAPSAVVTETQLKSASLPPGLALPAPGAKLSRSRSNAGARNTRDAFHEEDEPDDRPSKDDKKKEESFFGRFLSRRSAKKKKSKSEDADATVFAATNVVEKVESEMVSCFKHTEEKRTYSVDSGISKVIRSGPASRQRVQPIDIPASPDAGFRHKRQQNVDLDLPMPPSTSSPESSPPKKHHGYLNKQSKPTNSPPEKTIDSPAEITPIPSPRTIYPQSPPKPSWLENLQPLKPVSTPYTESTTKSEECKTKVKITGLSSYQQRVITYNDDVDSSDFKSLDETSEEGSVTKQSVSKSHSFRSKSVLSSTQDHSSLPFLVNSSNFDNSSDSETFTDSLISTSNTYSSTAQSSDHVSVTVKDDLINNLLENNDNEVKVINSNNIELSCDKSIKGTTCEQAEKVNLSEERLENKDDGITISCVNSQVQASVNTQSSNQVIVSISNTVGSVSNINEHTSTSKTFAETSVRETTSQVSVTKVQLKRESKQNESIQVPEFLKIQLNKVDAKPTTNVVLSTTSSFGSGDEKVVPKNAIEIQTDRDSDETTVEHLKQRKFSKEDVEIIDKDIDEEIVEVPSKNITITNLHSPVKSPNEHIKKQLPALILNNTNNVQQRKSSLASISPVSPTSAKPFLKKKSNSIELGDSIKKSDEKLLSENQNKLVTNSSDQLSIIKTEFGKEKTATSDEPIPDVILRKKSLVKRDKDGDEPELMKVFARRSLKLKDSEAEVLGQQVLVMVENEQKLTDSAKRDSDKENDGGESPPEERKRNSITTSKETPKQKEPLTESKYVETADVTLRKSTTTVNNKLASFGQKFQRAVTMTSPVTSEIKDSPPERKNKSYIEPKTEKKPVINNYRSHIMSIREKDVEIKKSTEITKSKTDDIIALKKDFENEDFVPLFKKIQQRKEEWEQRAQQNMKKSVP